MSHQKKANLHEPFNDPTKTYMEYYVSDFHLVDWVNNSVNGFTTYNHELQKLKLTHTWNYPKNEVHKCANLWIRLKSFSLTRMMFRL